MKQIYLFFVLFFFSLFFNAQTPVCGGRWGPPIVNQTFGKGNNTNKWYGPLATYAPGVTTSTIFVGTAGPPPGIGLTDGYSGLVTNPSTGVFINSPDHTGDPNGLMLLINAPSTAATVFVEYVMNNLCPNTTLKLSLWILNVNPPGTCGGAGGGYQFPNVTLRAVDSVTGNILGTSATGDIPTNKTWMEYSIIFNNASSTSVKLQFVNNSVGNGCGNDLAIDDITISPCIPSTIKPVPHGGTILCPNQKNTLDFTATLTGGAYNPAEYQWQYSINSGTTWTDLGIPTTNPNFTFDPVALPQSDTYWVRFKTGPQGFSLNSQCNAISDVSVVTIGKTPVANDAVIRSCFIESNPSTALFNLTTATVSSQAGVIKTYYPSQTDAINGTNEILNPTAYIAPAGVVYVKITDANGCYIIVQVSLIVFAPKYSDVLKDKIICIEDKTTLDAGTGFNGYEWSTGETTQSISNVGVGTYWVKLKTGDCWTTQRVKVYPSEHPVISNIDITNSTITINVIGGTPPYQYSLDEINWQTSNVFSNLPRGEAIVYVKDAYDCVPVSVKITVPNLVNTITPNNDGFNDVIDYSALGYKKNLVFNVYDRYGYKIYEAERIKGYTWDGTKFGRPVPTATYWYSIVWNEDDKKNTLVKYTGWVLVKNRE